MKSPYSSLRPQVEARVVGIDIARGLALMGIMYAHLHPPTPLVPYVLGNGVAPALFAILSGVSMAFVAGGLAPLKKTLRREAYGQLTIRALAILAIGLLLGLAENSIYIILVQFGALFLVSIPLLEVRKDYLYLLAFFWMIVTPFGSFYLRENLEPSRMENLSFLSLGDPAHFLSEVFFVGTYPVFFWLGYLMLGIAIGRTNLGRVKNVFILGASGLTVGLGSLALSSLLVQQESVRESIGHAYPGTGWGEISQEMAPGLFGVTPTEGGLGFLAVAVPHSGTPFDLFFTSGIAAAIIALCVWGYGWIQALRGGGQVADALRLFFGLGRMSLSLYALHVLMNSGLLPPSEDPPRLDIHYVVILTMGMIFALFAWRGPLEWLVSWPGKQLSKRSPQAPNDNRVI